MHNQQKFFIQEHLHKTVFHGGVGNIDVERILAANGYQAIAFPFHYNFSWRAKLYRYLYLLKVFYTVPSHSIIVFQFPLYARMHLILVRMLRRRKSIAIICLIADINGLKDGNAEVLKQETDALSAFHYFIVHGKRMDDWLKKQIPAAITARLNFFDFLSEPVNRHRTKSGVIAFAGNLSKSPFITHLHDVTAVNPQLKFNIYGPDPGKDFVANEAVRFMGVFSPYQLPALIEGSFGLLWDGESIHGAGGSLGDYMQFISHHKLSLYILAGLPVIAFQNAGSADSIKALNIGITVGSISDIADRINSLSEEAYQLMRSNMRPVAARISAGENLLSALSQVIEKMNV